MANVPHIETLFSVTWLPWTLLLIGLLLLLTEGTQKGYVRACFSICFSEVERRYEGTAKLLTYAFSSLFYVSINAMGLYVYGYMGGGFSFGLFALLLGMLCGVYLLKDLLVLMVQYIFSWANLYHVVRQQYMALRVFSAIWMWVMVVLYAACPMLEGTVWLLLLPVFVYLSIVLVKVFLQGFHDAASLVFILLYFLTLEVLPVTAVLVWIKPFIASYNLSL